MSIVDKFLNSMKLNDEDDQDLDEEYLDDYDDYDDYEEEQPARRRLLNSRIESRYDDEDFDDGEDFSAPASTADFDEEPPAPEPKSFFRRRSKEKASSRTKSSRSPKVAPLRSAGRRSSGQAMEVCVIKPRNMEDCSEITDTLVEGCTVILNMEGIDLDLAQRIIDFASGSSYALRGNLRKISNYIFIVTPTGVDISGDYQEYLNDSFDIPAFGGGRY